LGVKDEDIDGISSNLSLVMSPTALFLSELEKMSSIEDDSKLIDGVARIFSTNV